jgi:hypothetical protein
MPHDWKMVSDRYGLKTFRCSNCSRSITDTTVMPAPDSFVSVTDLVTGRREYLDCDEILAKTVHEL